MLLAWILEVKVIEILNVEDAIWDTILFIEFLVFFGVLFLYEMNYFSSMVLFSPSLNVYLISKWVYKGMIFLIAFYTKMI